MTLSACLLHAGYHAAPDEDCILKAAAWFMAHHHLPPAEIHAAYEAAVERRILDQHIRQHLKETVMHITPACDPEGERQPQPTEDEDMRQAA